MSAAPALSSRHWFGRAAAGLILGYTLAIGLSGLVAWFTPGGIEAGGGKLQFSMWITAPVWAGVLSFCFLFRTGLRAWSWLGLANLVVFALLFGGRALVG
ncbi:MAG TPA: hypothetical protein VMG08_21300 [Allosphingosinicella sp.]|nr:hypothetical protein [Allosphingosinicella sp.]